MSDEKVYDGYTEAELRAAFEKVQDKENWKNPINAVIPKEDLNVTMSAVTFFAGSLVDGWDNKDGTLTIYADGYYVDIGA